MSKTISTWTTVFNIKKMIHCGKVPKQKYKLLSILRWL